MKKYYWSGRAVIDLFLRGANSEFLLDLVEECPVIHTSTSTVVEFRVALLQAAFQWKFNLGGQRALQRTFDQAIQSGRIILVNPIDNGVGMEELELGKVVAHLTTLDPITVSHLVTARQNGFSWFVANDKHVNDLCCIWGLEPVTARSSAAEETATVRDSHFAHLRILVSKFQELAEALRDAATRMNAGTADLIESFKTHSPTADPASAAELEEVHDDFFVTITEIETNAGWADHYLDRWEQLIARAYAPRITKAVPAARDEKPRANNATGKGQPNLRAAEGSDAASWTCNTIVKPEQMAKLLARTVQRSANPPQVERIKRALRNHELVPSLLLQEVPVENGRPNYFIVDGINRATAAIGLNVPLHAEIFKFGSEHCLQRHWLNFQRSTRVNANLACEIFDNDAANAEVKRLASLSKHPLNGKVWFGRGIQPDESLAATTLTGAIIRGDLALEDLETCTRVVGALWPIRRKSLSYRGGGLRGLVAFYRALKDSGHDRLSAKYVAHLQEFNWETVRAHATNNTALAGQIICAALLQHGRVCKA